MSKTYWVIKNSQDNYVLQWDKDNENKHHCYFDPDINCAMGFSTIESANWIKNTFKNLALTIIPVHRETKEKSDV